MTSRIRWTEVNMGDHMAITFTDEVGNWGYAVWCLSTAFNVPAEQVDILTNGTAQVWFQPTE